MSNEGAVKSVRRVSKGVESAALVAGSNVKQANAFPPMYVQIDLPANVNAVVGNPHAGGWAAADHALKVITSEFKELTGNVNERNHAKLADDIADVLFTLIGFAYATGHLDNVNENFYRVCHGQYEKFDRSAADAAITAKKYQDKSLVVHVEEVVQNNITFWVTKSSIEQAEPGREAPMPAGKWLKSYRFIEPEMIQPSKEIQDKFVV